MEIKIRQKPQRSTGKTSLVLEYYYGYTRDDEGRIKHRRKFETLEYYLYTDPKNKLERDHNKVNLEMAEKVKAKRLLAEQNEQYGFAVKYKIRTNLVEYIKGLIEQRKESPGNWGNWDSALKHLVAYAGTNTTFEMVDKKFVEGFKTYLAKQAKTKSNTALSTNSQSSYFLKLKAALNRAVEEGIIPHSPAMSVKPAHIEDVHREYRRIAAPRQNGVSVSRTKRCVPLLVPDRHALERHQQTDVGRSAGVRRRHAHRLPAEKDQRA